MKNKLLLILLIFFIRFSSYATHIVGGSLTYDQLGGSTYRITLKLYRDCAPGNYGFDPTITIEVKKANGTSFSPSKNISISLGTVTKLDPYLDTCVVKQNICVEEAIYTKIVNNLPPVAGGYHLFWQRCCRNGTLSNIVNPGDAGESFYAFIPDNNSLITNSSPTWVNSPPTFVCQGLPIDFDHAATDADGDSLVYKFYNPYVGCDGGTPSGPNCPTDYPTFTSPPNVATFNTVTWNTGYSTTNPLGGAGLTLSPTGILNGIPPNIGQFVIGVKCEEWRNGVKIGEILRDFQFNVVNCPPVAVASFVPSSGCNGTAITFTNTTTPSASNYSWNFGNGATLADTSHLISPSYTYPAIGIYTATLIINKGTPCADTSSQLINLSYVIAGFTNDVPACQNVPINFVDTSRSAPTTTITNWDWKFGDGNISTLQNPSHPYTASGSYTVTLITTTASGCKDTATRVITIRTSPAAAFTVNGSCYVDSVGFTNNSTIGSGTISNWSWNFGDGNTSSLQNPNHYYTASGLYNITLIATSALGCKDTITVPANVKPAPKANFSSTTACTNTLVSFTDGSTVSPGPSSITSWNWNFGDGNTSTLQNPTHNFSVAGSYNVTLTVMTTSACSNAIVKIIVVNTAPLAAFSANTTCYIDSVSFNNTSSIASGSINNWNWNFGDGNSSALQNPAHYYTASGNYNITLIATSALGCKDTAVISANVQPAPKANFNSSGVCSNTSISFNDASVISPGPASITSWSWNFGDSNTSSLQNPTHIYTNDGSYIITFIATSQSGCVDTIVKTISIDPAPTVAFTATTSCYIDSVRFNNTSSIASSTIASWNWNFGDGNTSSLQNPSHYYTASGNYSISLVATSALGCKDTSIITVNVQPAPKADFTFIGSCTNPLIAFTDASTISPGPASISSWSWNFGDNGTSSLQNPSHIYAAEGSYVVTFIAISQSGCVDTIIKTVSIDPAPVATFSANATCYTDSVAFTNTSSISSGSITNWNWNFGDGNLSNLQNPNHFYASSGIYNITLIVTSALGCKDTSMVPVSIQPAPNANFSSTGTCANSLISFTDASTILPGPAGISSWSWNFGDGNTSILQNPNHVYLNNGTYTVTLIASAQNGCVDSITKIINLDPSPQVAFTANTNCYIDSVTFTNTSSITSGSITNWTWNFGDSNTSTSQNPIHYYAASGNYTITLIATSALGCTDTSVITADVQPAPKADFTYTGVCTNTLIPFTDASTITPGPASITSWNWNFGDGGTSTLQNPAHMYLSAATYTVTLVVTAQSGCFDSIVKTIIINSAPQVSFTTSNTCFIDSIAFTNTSTIATGTISSWNWSFGDGNTSVVQDPSNVYSTSGNYNVTLIATSNLGCIDTSTAAIYLTHLNSGFTDNSPSCSAFPISFIDISTLDAGTTILTWNWNFGDNTTSTTQNPIHLYNAGTYNAQLIITTATGCVDTVIHSITLTPSPSSGFSSTNACPGFPITFTDSSTSPVSINSWNWDFGDGSPSNTSQNPTHIYNIGGPHSISLIISSSNGCKDTLTQILNVYNKPLAGFDADGNCLNEGVQFSDTSTVGGSTITSWSWNFGDASASILQNPAHTYASGGNYNASLIVQSAQGCIDTVTQTLSILSAPTANFSANPPTANVNQPVQFSGQSSSGTTSWFWNFGDSQSDSASTLQNPSHVYLTAGIYNVCLYITDGNGCMDTICKPEIILLPPTVPSGFTPNGDGENDIFYVYGGPFTTLDLTIYNNWGEIIFTSNKQNEGWDGKRKGIDQPIGVYVYIVNALTEDGEAYKLSGDVTLIR